MTIDNRYVEFSHVNKIIFFRIDRRYMICIRILIIIVMYGF